MENTKKKCVIFDLDGTLTNTLVSLWKSTNLSLADANLPEQPLDAYRYFVGDGADELVRRALKAAGDVDLSQYTYVREQYNKHFSENVNYKVEPYDGIPELLKALKDKGIYLAVNSNKPHDRTVDVVKNFFGDDTFDMVVGQSDERERKPSADGANYIMNTLGVKKEECIYIGDTCVDMKTGKNAGVFTVGALWGFRDYDELKENHADAIISHPMELIQYI